MKIKTFFVSTVLLSMGIVAFAVPQNVNAEITVTEATSHTEPENSNDTEVAKDEEKVTSPTKFTDLKSSASSYKYVTYLAKKGCIGGYTDGKFKASTTMTQGKFVCILMRAIDTKSARASKGKDYDAKVIKRAYELGIVKYSEMSEKDVNKSLTQGYMSIWAARALEYKNGNKDTKQLTSVENLVTNWSKVTKKYQDSVKDLYSSGVLSSKTFESSKKVSRGTACTVIAKVANSDYRKKVTQNSIPTDQQAALNASAITIKATDKNRKVLPKAGDTWVAKDGTKTKLEGIMYGGTYVPGYSSKTYSQGINIYANMSHGSDMLKNGDLGAIWEDANGGKDSTYMGQPFTTYTYKKGSKSYTVGWFKQQWESIASYELTMALKIKSPKNGQRVGSFTVYNSTIKMWVFEVSL